MAWVTVVITGADREAKIAELDKNGLWEVGLDISTVHAEYCRMYQ